MQKYYTIITNRGLEKQSQFLAQENQTLKLIHLAVGDGNGFEYDPTGNETALKNEKHRTDINKIYIDSNNHHQVVIETVIPANIGGFTIREVGIFDEDGDLFAIGKYPQTFKPTIDNGAIKDLYIRMVLRFSNSPGVELIVDPNVAMVSVADVKEFVEIYTKEDFEDIRQSIAKNKGNTEERLRDIDNKIQEINQITLNLLPTGTILPFAGDNIPNGYLKCDGSELSRDIYHRLYNAIGLTYGNGDGTYTFNIPDFRDRTIQGGGGYFEVGSILSSGLPNIAGQISVSVFTRYADGAFAKNGISVQSAWGWDQLSNQLCYTFDASRISSVYGNLQNNGARVQAPATVVHIIIKY